MNEESPTQEPSRSQGKILVIRGGAIGDFILTLPVFAALRERFPQTHLEVLGYPHIAGLALAGGWVDAMRPIEARGLAGFFARNGVLDTAWAEFFSNFAVIISFLFDPDEIFRQNVARISKAQFIQGPHRPDEAADTHATAVFLKPLERLAIFEADPEPRLKIQVPPPTGGGHRWLALHPGSGSEKKNWPESSWAELLKVLTTETSWNFLLVGGEAEGDRLARLERCVPSPRRELARSLPLTQLAERLARCDFFVGHDSGISHLAAALGLRGLVLWGETNLNVWRPRSPRFEILHAENGLFQLQVHRVLAGIPR